MSYKWWVFIHISAALTISSGRDRERRQQRLKMSFFNATTVRGSNMVPGVGWMAGLRFFGSFWSKKNLFCLFFLHQKWGFNSTQHGPNGCQRRDRSIWIFPSKSSQRIPAKNPPDFRGPPGKRGAELAAANSWQPCGDQYFSRDLQRSPEGWWFLMNIMGQWWENYGELLLKCWKSWNTLW